MLSRHCRRVRSLGAVAACLVAAALAGCSSSGAGGGEGGGAASSAGGSTGSGGATGGARASGGASGGSSGASGAGGSGSSGASGAGGSGGTAVGTGGAIGDGGSTGVGGSTSGAGGSAGHGGGGASAGGSTGTGGAKGGASGSTGTDGAKGGTSGSTGTGGTGGASGGVGGGSAGGGGAYGGAGGTASSCPAATPLTGGKQYCSSSKGTADGSYSYELWSNGTGTGCMTVYGVDAAFSATWTGVGDLLARNGLAFDETKTPSQIGTISSDFAETKTGSDGLVYVGIYGWTVNPLREYYILDDWGSTMPGGTASDGTARTHVGTITVDGGTYDVWKHTQMNKPNITGTDQNFDQYFSVRQTARQCGHISISQHFSQWATLGLQLGNLEEAKLLVEAQNSTGTIAFTTATVVVK